MQNPFLDQIQATQAAQAAQSADQQRQDALISAVMSSGQQSSDQLTAALHDLLLATMVSKDPRIAEVAQNLTQLLSGIQSAAGSFENSPLSLLPDLHAQLINAIQSLPEYVAATDKAPELIPYLEAIITAITRLDIAPKVEVSGPDVDLKPLQKLLKELKDAITASSPEFDTSALEKATGRVENAVRELIARPIPVPEFPTTMKISDSRGNDILDPTAGYAPSDVDEASDPKYYGFLAADGRWYIMKNTGDTTFRYCTGMSSYASNWANRATLTYDYFSEVF